MFGTSFLSLLHDRCVAGLNTSPSSPKESSAGTLGVSAAGRVPEAALASGGCHRGLPAAVPAPEMCPAALHASRSRPAPWPRGSPAWRPLAVQVRGNLTLQMLSILLRLHDSDVPATALREALAAHSRLYEPYHWSLL